MTEEDSGERLSQDAYEGEVGRRLCGALGDPWTLVGKKDPPAADLLVEVATNRVPVAVELGRYRQRGVVNEFSAYDARFQSIALDAWTAAPEMRGVVVHLQYAAEGERPCIPRPQEARAIMPDLISLCVEFSGLPYPGCRVTFGPTGEDDERRTHSTAIELLRTGRYPSVARYFRAVDIYRADVPAILFPQTSLTPMYLGLDEGQLCDLTSEKVKRAARYREAARDSGAKELWLVIHADGIPLSATVAAPQLPRAFDIIRDETRSAGKDGAYDAILWFSDVFMVRGGNLHVVQSRSELL